MQRRPLLSDAEAKDETPKRPATKQAQGEYRKGGVPAASILRATLPKALTCEAIEM